MTNKEITKDKQPIVSLETLRQVNEKANETKGRKEDKKKTKPFHKNNIFLHYDFATFLKEKHHFILLDDNNLYCYNGTHYEYMNNLKFNKLVLNELQFLTERQRKEVKSTLMAIAENKQLSDPRYLSLENGVYDIENNTLLEATPDFILSNHLPVTYDPKATSEILEKFLNDISNNDLEIRMLLEEIIGYALYGKPFMQKCFIFYASGSNGKSAFLKLLNNFFSDDNTTQLSLSDLKDETKLHSLLGKILSIGDDISAAKLKESGNFKKLISGEPIALNIKYQVNTVTLRNTATLIFSCNQLPDINDTTDGLYRRLILIPFNNTFKKELGNLDLNINEKLNTKEIHSALFNIALRGLKRVLNNKEFTNPQEVQEMLTDYRKSNNSVLQFIEDVGIENIIRNSTKDVHAQYSNWALDNGIRSMTRPKLTQEINAILNLKSESRKIDCKSIKLFLPKN